jgi:DNA-directed RNA polymerase specialized sigma subunit
LASYQPMTEGQQALAADNMGLIGKVLRVYFPDVARAPDLHEETWLEASLALCRAAQAFDPDRGIAFSTFACRCVLNHLRRWFPWERRRGMTRSSAVVPPVNVDEVVWAAVPAAEAGGPPGDPFTLGRLEPAVRALTPVQQVVVRAFYQEGAMDFQVAGRLGLGRSRAGQLRNEAVGRLREVVDAEAA